MASPQHFHFVVIPDTQALFVQKDRLDDVNPAFSKAIADCREHCTITLAVPEAVRAEILYQKISNAFITAKRAQESLTTLSELTKLSIPPIVPPDTIKHAVTGKFDAWLAANKATLLPHSINEQTWSGIIDKALWRLPSFEHSEDGQHEKGFRDSLIMTAVVAFAKANPKKACAFISQDALLRTAITSEKVALLHAFESIKLFLGHVSLLRSHFDEQLAKQLQANAATMFFAAENPKSLYYTFQIADKIKSAFNLVLAFPHLATKSDNPLVQKIEAALNEAETTWLQVGDEKIYVYGTAFDARLKPNLFQWKSRVLFVGLFQPLGNATLQKQHKIRKTFCDVTWESSIAEAAIEVPEYKTVTLGENTFSNITDEDIRTFKLEVPQVTKPRFADLMIDISKALQQGAVASAKIQATQKPTS